MSGFTGMMSKEWDRMKRFTAEKLGTVEQLTEFPEEYVQLSNTLTHTEAAFQAMQRYGKEFIANGTYEEVPYAESMKGVISKLNTKLNLSSSSVPSTVNQERTTVHHRYNTLLRDASDNLPYGSDMAGRLNQLATAHHSMAEARADMDRSIKQGYLKPIKELLAGRLKAARDSCDAAEKARFELNSIKSRCKKAQAAELLKLQEKLQAGQEKYTRAVDEAISLMGLVTKASEVAIGMQTLIDAERDYYQTCLDALASC